LLPRRIPIPPTFYAEDTEAPFDECLACERPLRTGSVDYIIEKGVRSFDDYDVEETVFGYALCAHCHSTIGEGFSDGSRRRCRAYLEEHLDLHERATALRSPDSADPAQWTQRCAVHGTPKAELQEYQLLAHCRGDSLLLSHLPILIGGPAVEALVQRLSNETLDELGGFQDEHFGLPPELQRRTQGPVLA